MKSYSTAPILALVAGALIFSIQPMVGKELLPYVGGSAYVWVSLMCTCILLMVVAYEYGRWLTKKSIKTVHLIYTATAACAIASRIVYHLFFAEVVHHLLRVLHPEIAVIVLILVSLGVPLILLGTTTMLLSYMLSIQKERVYPIYVWSSVGSLVGLCIYPFIIERYIPISYQQIIWTIIYTICIWMIRRSLQVAKKQMNHDIRGENTIQKDHIPPIKYGIWLTASSISVCMTFSLVRLATLELPAMPFTWLIPNALYLVSYVVGFSNRSWKLVCVHVCIGVSMSGALLLHHGDYIQITAWLKLVLVSIGLWSMQLLLHNALYRTRPAETSYGALYTTITYGGAIGAIVSLSVSLFAIPQLAIVGMLMIIGWGILIYVWSYAGKRFVLIGSIALICVIILFSPRNLQLDPPAVSPSLYRNTNLYGDIDVRQESPTVRLLYSGNVYHGEQLIGTPYEQEPSMYYKKDSGLGIGLTAIRNRRNGSPLLIGNIGLGIGTTAAYCIRDDQMIFYELNPAVIHISSTYFTYLQGCTQRGGRVMSIQGDGRIELSKHLAITEKDRFDILTIDAFTGDAIPTHVLTDEAMKLYLEKTKEDGAIFFHITNTYLDLSSVIQNLAIKHGLQTYTVENSASVWVIVSKTPIDSLQAFRSPTPASTTYWTDQYSSIIDVIKR